MRKEQMHLPPVIIGAGPTGLSAAKAFIEAGIRPILLEESLLPGGQGTRRLHSRIGGLGSTLFGRSYFEKSLKREAEEDRVLAQCDYRPNTMAWAIYNNAVSTTSDGIRGEVKYSQLLIAIGATDRILAVDGWQKSGVYTLGGAQVALKTHASTIGKKIVFAGSSPLLYLAAAQYSRLGYKNITILDTTAYVQKMRASIGMMRFSFKTFVDGVRLIAELKRHGIQINNGIKLVRFEGDDSVEAVTYLNSSGLEEQVACDAVAFGYGLRSETQLAELAGAAFDFDPVFRQWFPKIDDCGRARDTLWLAGDSSAIGGVDAAAASGRLAALTMLKERNIQVDDKEIARLKNTVQRLRRFQREMTRAFKWPHETVENLPDRTYACRCERVTVGDIRSTIKAEIAHTEVNRIKAITRCGMGRCQGRYCSQTLQELATHVSGVDVCQVGRLRAQAPFRPIPVGMMDPSANTVESHDA